MIVECRARDHDLHLVEIANDKDSPEDRLYGTVWDFVFVMSGIMYQ